MTRSEAESGCGGIADRDMSDEPRLTTEDRFAESQTRLAESPGYARKSRAGSRERLLIVGPIGVPRPYVEAAHAAAVLASCRRGMSRCELVR
jgi:hypothetical protein